MINDRGCSRVPRTVREYLAAGDCTHLSLELVAAAIAGYATTAAFEIADRLAVSDDALDSEWASGADVRGPAPR